MTLLEFMRKQDDDTIVHIASQTAFFFVGTKSEFEEKIDGILEGYMERAKARMKDDSDYLDYMLSNIPQKKDDQSALEYSDILQSFAKSLRTTARGYEAAKRYIECFTPAQGREVLEHYPRQLGDGIIVMVKGNEIGKYWDRAEFERGEGKCIGSFQA